MKKILLVVLCVFLLVSLASCKCKHEWEAATCEKPQTCSKCGEQQGEPLGHEWEAATCEKPQTCSKCGEQQGEPLGHEWEVATCEKPQICSRCGKQQGEPLGHKFSDDWATTEEEHWHEALCEHTELTQDRAEHEWDDGEITTTPTCYDDGIQTFTCKICGHTKTEDIPATWHVVDWEGTIIKEPTCNEKGTIVYYCSNCGLEMYTDSVPATGEHSYVNYKCSACGNLGTGPAGGYVFYDCDDDNNSGNADGLISTECGWRYLEAAPSDLDGKFMFGYYRPSGQDYGTESIGTEAEIGAGKANTEALVTAMGESTYRDSSGSRKIKEYAAKACLDYTITVSDVVYDDWFLPSIDELDLMYANLHKNGLGSFADYYYWSSSEKNDSRAWEQDFFDGSQFDFSRSSDFYVRPIRAFN